MVLLLLNHVTLQLFLKGESRMRDISNKVKRETYKKAFGKEYDDKKRKQAPLPLDIAY